MDRPLRRPPVESPVGPAVHGGDDVVVVMNGRGSRVGPFERTDLPWILLSPFGVTHLENLLLFTHTVGIVLLPLGLVIIDIFLIELNLLKYLEPFNRIVYPKSLRIAIKIEKVVERLQKYNAIPRAIRVRRVYLVGVFSGSLQFVVYVLFEIL